MNHILSVLKVILFEFLVSVALLLILAFAMYHSGMEKTTARFIILLIYLVSTFLGGFILGKMKNSRRIIWGTLAGAIYILVLFLVSIAIHTEYTGTMNLVLSIGACMLGGILGGMFS